jgi:hypothetical protein
MMRIRTEKHREKKKKKKKETEKVHTWEQR